MTGGSSCDDGNFYPRSPCGERRSNQPVTMRTWKFLSTLSLRRATQAANGLANAPPEISIHALLAESDGHTCNISANCLCRISIHALLAESDGFFFCPFILDNNFYPRSPCGERPTTIITICIAPRFLSTLSLRRATTTLNNIFELFPISIHALLAESDIPNSGTFRSTHNFYPRSPCGERQYVCMLAMAGVAISIHALLAESDPRYLTESVSQ